MKVRIYRSIEPNHIIEETIETDRIIPNIFGDISIYGMDGSDVYIDHTKIRYISDIVIVMDK